jgi:glucokinase
MRVRLGIDIGGTKVNMGILTLEGQLLIKRKIAVPPGVDCKTLMALVAAECEQLLKQCGLRIDDVCFMGMGVPGSVDKDQNIVLHAPNLHFVNAHCADMMEMWCGIHP